MVLTVSVLVTWIAYTALLFMQHGPTLRALWREPMLARPVLIVESDDWGPGPASDAAVLDRLKQLLTIIRDGEGRPAVLTLGVVLGKPDGAAILADDCRAYYRSTLAEPRYGDIVRTLRDGCSGGVFTLQRHGLEHCWPHALLARARNDESLRKWLADPQARSEALPSSLQSRWIDTTTLPSVPLSEAVITDAVVEERNLFASIFGEVAVVAVPNTFVWSSDVERAWAASGVRCVVTCGRQFVGRRADGELMPAERIIRNGEQGSGGVRYVVRDAYFEPARGHRAEQVWHAVQQHSEQGRPTLLETHRENFIDPNKAESALAELDRALRGVRERHDDVRFMSTEAVVDAFADQDNPLHVKRRGARICIFLRRLCAEAALSRALKLSGLHFIIPLALRLARVVRCVSSVKPAYR